MRMRMTKWVNDQIENDHRLFIIIKLWHIWIFSKWIKSRIHKAYGYFLFCVLFLVLLFRLFYIEIEEEKEKKNGEKYHIKSLP